MREVVFELNVGPVSQQARGEVKQAFKNQLQVLTAAKDFLFTGDVRVGVEWAIHEQVRYETDRAADVDNVLKPLVDALAGPAGIMLDDNQVQSISCHWIDSYQLGVERVRITVEDPMGLTYSKKVCALFSWKVVSASQFPAHGQRRRQLGSWTHTRPL